MILRHRPHPRRVFVNVSPFRCDHGMSLYAHTVLFDSAPHRWLPPCHMRHASMMFVLPMVKSGGGAPDTVTGVMRVGGHTGLASCPDSGGRHLRGELGDLGRQRLHLRRQRHDAFGKLAVDLTRLRGDRRTALSDCPTAVALLSVLAGVKDWFNFYSLALARSPLFGRRP